jgi:hypothetical protein
VGLAHVSVAYDYAELTIFKPKVLVYLIDTKLASIVVLALEGALEVW